MGKLLAIAEAVLLEKVVTGGWNIAHKSKAGIFLWILCGLLLIVAAGFGVAAFHAWAQLQYQADPYMADLVTSGAVLGLAFIAALSGWVVLHQRQLRRESMREEVKNNLQAVIGTLDDELGDHIRENPATAVLLATVAGFILADRIL